jgi:Zn-dependent metalloprotease
MPSRHDHTNPPDALCCVVPDFLLERIAQKLVARRHQGANAAAAAKTETAAAKAAIETITADAGFHAQRMMRLETKRAMFEMVRELEPPVAEQALGAAPPHFRRTVYDAEHRQSLPGKRVRGEQDGPVQGPGKEEANEAFDGAGAVLDFYYRAYSRNSINNRGMAVNSSVHYGQGYDNAFWNGRQMVYGDGDGHLFNRFTIDLDIIGHELTHGVTEREAGLVYVNQPGALNESISDVFGSLVKQFQGNQTADQADWLIGEHLFTQEVHGEALRSLKAPGTAYDDPVLGKDPQPAHMKDYVRGTADNGGVHINSGIPNHAFFLAATAIGGHAWERAGLIWYTTLRNSAIVPRTRFAGFANVSVRVARRLFGARSHELGAVRDAWHAVGVL